MSGAKLVLGNWRLKDGRLSLAFAGAGGWHSGPKSANCRFERPIGGALYAGEHAVVTRRACEFVRIFRFSACNELLDAMEAKRVATTRQDVRAAKRMFAIVAAHAHCARKRIIGFDGGHARGFWNVGNGLIRVRQDLRHVVFCLQQLLANRCKNAARSRGAVTK